VVVAGLVVVVGGGGGARAAGRWAPLPWIFFFCFMKIALPRAKWTLGTTVPRAIRPVPRGSRSRHRRGFR
jgi:hypothetical protein